MIVITCYDIWYPVQTSAKIKCNNRDLLEYDEHFTSRLNLNLNMNLLRSQFHYN